MFDQPFSFTGRIRRTEYGLSLIISFFINLIFSLFAQTGEEAGAIIYLIIIIPILWFNLAQGAKRCHDLGNSGWYQIIPFYGLWLLFAEGDHGPNRYGEDPKSRNVGYVQNNSGGNTSTTSKTGSGSYQGGYNGGHNNPGGYSSGNSTSYSGTLNNSSAPNYSAPGNNDGGYKPGELYK